MEAADEALRALAGEKPIHQESSTDANIPLSLGIAAHTVGAVEGDLLHTREEWVEKASLRRGLAVTSPSCWPTPASPALTRGNCC